ncbi:hypothetical protein ACSSS7_003548 [Eimeria intestinalis]
MPRPGSSLAHLLGMRFFAVDSCWMQEGPATPETVGPQEIKTNEADFPYGMASVAQAVKKHGLIFGLGVTVSNEACPELEPTPSKIKEVDLIHKASEWGASFLKVRTALRHSIRMESFPVSMHLHKCTMAMHACSKLQMMLWFGAAQLNACSSSQAQAVADFKRWSDAVRASSTRPFLICTWTRETPESNKDPRASDLAALGSQLVVTASSISQFDEQVRRRPGPGGAEVLSRQLADGDYVVAVVNWSSSPINLSASHADVLAWCGLENPVPLLVEQAWSDRHLHLTSGQGEALKQEIPPYGTMLLQVELTDNLADSQQAVVIADSHSTVWTNSALPLFPVMDVFHREDLPPAFTTANRVVHAPPQTALNPGADHNAGGQFHRADAGRNNTGSSLDLFLKTALNLLLPVMVASAFNEEEHTKKHKNHRHHKRHHHHHKHKHKDHEAPHRKHEDHQPLANDDTHLHIQSSLRHSTIERTEPKGTAEGQGESAVVSDAAEHGAEPGHASSSAGWLLLSGVVVLVCLAVVAAWRALMLRLNTSKPSWKPEDTQLVERPHLH